MEPRCTVRAATETDAAAIQAIYAPHVLHGTATFETEPPTVEEMLTRMRHLLDNGHPYLVAECDARVVGYAYAGPFRPRAGYRFTVEDSIYLDPAYVGRGIGTKLLTRLLAECRQRGYRQVIASIGDSANSASIELHSKLGFQMVGTLLSVGYKFERWIDSVYMQLEL